jgi:methyltransferase (TIGR00027 family)
MTRSDTDSWDLSTSVGATATLVAAARAVASRRADPLVNDPFAEPLVKAAGIELFARLARGDLDFDDIGPSWLADFFGVRARFFDAFFPAALATGIHQAVIVGSGLDSRAYQLDWPAGAIVYEIDKPEVIEFKNSTLAGLGATPTTQLRTVNVDLRQDWPQALQQAGFDVAEPTAWLAEGLMIGYLPGQAQERLLDTITALSAPGSQLSADYLPSRSKSIGSMILDTAKDWKEQGFDVDFGTLTFAHDRSDVLARLQAHGWQTTTRGLADLLNDAGLSDHTMDTDPNGPGAINYLTATRN